MSFARLSLSLAGVVGVIAAALAAATIWLIMRTSGNPSMLPRTASVTPSLDPKG